MSRRGLCGAAAVIAAVGLLAAVPRAQTKAAWPPVLPAPAAGEIEVVPVQGDVYMLAGAGANITLFAGQDGMLLVDTGSQGMSDKVWAAVQSVSKKPLRYIVNTSEYADHTGGNAAIAPKGKIIPLRERNYTAGPMGTLEYDRASVIAYLTVLHRMSGIGRGTAAPQAAWPDNTFSTPLKRFALSGEPIVVMHQPSNSDGNSLVHFRKSDVVSAGDLVDLTGYPRIEVENGGGVQVFVEGLNRLIDITVPSDNASGGTLVIPGHGRVADLADVASYRDMMTVVRDRINDMIKRKMTLEQVRAARPTRDYDPRYGRTSGAWTTDMFVEAVYRSLSPRTN
jgi:cyclase